MIKARYLHVVIWALPFLVVGGNANAFNSDEHEDMGNAALRIALDMDGIDCQSRNDISQDPFDAACSLIPESSQKKQAAGVTATRESTYGFIVNKVDFMLDPAELLASIGDHIGYPRNVYELNPTLIGQYSRQRADYLRSSHNNESHFQGYTLFNQFDWHSRARQIAAERKNLYAALIANAISDHYLHDAFAPGHIVTPRYNFEDEFSLGMHDYWNKVGSNFTTAHWDELAPILQFVKESPPDNRSPSQPRHYGFREEDISTLEGSHTTIKLQGDGFLKGRGDEELFITLVEVVSIREILACYKSSADCAEPQWNRFSEYGWHPNTVSTKSIRAKGATAQIYFGEQSFEPSKFVFTPAISIIGVSAGEESVFASGGARNRANFTIETVPLGLPGAPDFARFPHNPGTADSDRPVSSRWRELNLGLALGWFFSIGPGDHVSGLSTRLIFAFPLEDMEVSTYYRYGKLSENGFSSWRSTYGLRFDVGFSVLKGYIGIGNDSAINRVGRISPALMLSFGFEIAGPVSRIPVLSLLE